jgi:hypothetical protein
VRNATKGEGVTRQRCGRKERRMIGRRYTGENGREVEMGE